MSVSRKLKIVDSFVFTEQYRINRTPKNANDNIAECFSYLPSYCLTFSCCCLNHENEIKNISSGVGSLKWKRKNGLDSWDL